MIFFLQTFKLACLIVFAYMSFWFVIGRLLKRNDVADIAWGLGFVFVSWITFLKTGWGIDRRFLAVFLITLWGFRLAWHIFNRLRVKPEDARYQKYREQWKKGLMQRMFV